jgi:two-component system sensor histidine kinase UhpB
VIATPGRLGVRVLFLLGFAAIFLVWLTSAYLLVQRMAGADSRGAAMRSRFLYNEQLLSTVRALAARSAPPAVARPLQEARAITDRTLQSVRALSHLLHPSMLDDLGLPDTATWYVRRFSQRTGIASELVVERLKRRLHPEVESSTYRIIQEALTNVARHAEASLCRVEISQVDASLRISIEDNGKGFDPAAASPAVSRGLGLVSVRERAARLGGTLSVVSKVGAGTRLPVDLPVPQGAEAS